MRAWHLLMLLAPVGLHSAQVPSARPRVILVAVPGFSTGGANLLVREAAERPDGAVALALAGGTFAPLWPIDAPLTAVSRASLVTGARPHWHGVVANSFHLAGTPITQGTSGFDRDQLLAESLTGAARRQGLRVIRIGQLPIGSAPLEREDIGLDPGEQLSPARVLDLSLDAEAPSQGRLRRLQTGDVSVSLRFYLEERAGGLRRVLIDTGDSLSIGGIL